MPDYRERAIKAMLWGIFLIVIGMGFLLERLGILPNVGGLWPAVFYVLGIMQVIQGRLGSAVMFLLMGTVFFACSYGWFGMTFRSGWPLILVAVGMGIVVKAVTGEGRRRIGGDAS